MQPKTIYVALASVLQTNSDLAFIGVMVEVCVCVCVYLRVYICVYYQEKHC